MNYQENIRDIKLNILMSNYKITINPSMRMGKFAFLRPGYKLIKNLTEMGSILTGSRALKCYSINDKPLFDRKPDDWDFIVTEKMAMKICDENGITSYVKTPNKFIIPINKNLILLRGSYGDTRIIPTNIQLIIKDELPSYNEVNSIKIADFSYIIDEKLKLFSKYDVNKHEHDVRQMIARFSNLEL